MRPTTMDSMLRGAIGGLIATIPMTATMEVLHRALPRHQQHPLPPREITEELAERSGLAAAGVLDREEDLRTAAIVSHFAYGAASGTLYGAVADRLPGGAVGGGVLFGLAVWAGSYLGWLPAVGIRRPPTEQPPEREALMILAHVVWGAATGWLTQRLPGATSGPSASSR